MTACLCPRCSTEPAEKYSDAWKTETEGRFVLSMPIAQRRAYLEKLKQPRRAVLEAEVRRLWNESRSTKQILDETI